VSENIGKTGTYLILLKRYGLMAAAPGVRRSELGEALRACRSAFIGVGVMSCMINLLYLTGSIFMLEVYDRVLPSRSVPTLVGLVILAAGLYAAQGGLDLAWPISSVSGGIDRVAAPLHRTASYRSNASINRR
jgi:ABC-type protease/lipase transport system fused ATPase/permease subunit